MKRSFLFLLAAGPLFVLGQRFDQPPAFKSFQFSAPAPGSGHSLWPGYTGDTAFFHQGLTAEPVLPLPGFPASSWFPTSSGRTLLSEPTELPVRVLLTTRFTVKEMPPDGMSCLVPLRMPEQMPVDLRGNADRLPNTVPRR